jgi:hypothetical protein
MVAGMDVSAVDGTWFWTAPNKWFGRRKGKGRQEWIRPCQLFCVSEPGTEFEEGISITKQRRCIPNEMVAPAATTRLKSRH